MANSLRLDKQCKKKNNERKMELVNKYKIPKIVIERYGEENIRGNIFLLETLQTINRLTGKWYLSDEDRQIRKSVNKEQTSYRLKLETAVEKVCENCGKTYTKLDLGKCVRNTVNCSKECSKERRRKLDIIRKKEDSIIKYFQNLLKIIQVIGQV